jgi:multidrug transporter EmrE-like cation transporter
MQINKIPLIILAILLQSFSLLFIKYANLYSQFLLVVAFTFMILRAYFWQIILKYNELSKVYPFNALVQVLVLIYASFLFQESIDLHHIIGIVFMCIGIAILGYDR